QPSHAAAYWQHLCNPAHGVLILAGDITECSKRLERMERALASLHPIAELPTEPDWQPVAHPELIRVKRDRQQAIVMRAFPGYGIVHDQEVVDSVLTQMLSGMGSHLFERVR